jgi:hypothetical protein
MPGTDRDCLASKSVWMTSNAKRSRLKGLTLTTRRGVGDQFGQMGAFDAGPVRSRSPGIAVCRFHIGQSIATEVSAPRASKPHNDIPVGDPQGRNIRRRRASWN